MIISGEVYIMRVVRPFYMKQEQGCESVTFLQQCRPISVSFRYYMNLVVAKKTMIVFVFSLAIS